MSHREKNYAPVSETETPYARGLQSRLPPLLIDFLQTMNDELDSLVMTETVPAN